MTLELIAMRWLWLERKCKIVLEQRSPRYWMGNPDVIGVTGRRHLLEIEIKRSLSDFRADAFKHHRMPATRQFHITEQPRQFYYLSPRDLTEKILPALPAWAGLMRPVNSTQAEVVRVAPVNAESRKLNLRECVKLARLMTNHMMTYAQHCETHHQQFIDRDEQIFIEWSDHKAGTYQI